MTVRGMEGEAMKNGRGWRSAGSCFEHAVLVVVAVAAAGRMPLAATYHVSPAGSDTAAGSASHPFRTIQRAADEAQAGDTVLVAPGVYRERVAPPRGGEAGRPIVFRSAERHAAVLKGSERWEPNWESHGGEIWSGVVEDELFSDTAHIDAANPFAVPLASTPWGRDGYPEHERHRRGERGGNASADPDVIYTLGQVFVDGAMLRQVPLRRELDATPGTWHYDATAHRLYLHGPAGGPHGRVVEITTRRRIFAPHERGLGHIHVEGFVMEHCGNQYPTDFWVKAAPQWQQAGALGTRGGHHWTIRGNVIRLAQGVGLDLGVEGHPEADLEHGGRPRPASAGHHVVEDNLIVHNGGAGTAGYLARDLVVRRNVVVGNNLLRFHGKKRWESAGIKLHSPHGSLIEANVIVGNHSCPGLWLDQGAGNGTRIVDNAIVGHDTGLDIEIGRGRDAVATGNVIADNGVGIAFREAGGVRVIDNLIVSRSGTAVKNANDPKRPGDWTSGPIQVTGNVIAGAMLVAVVPPGSGRSEARSFDGNVYAPSAEVEPPFFIAGSGRMGFRDWRQYWLELNGPEGSDGRSVVASGFACSLDRRSGVATFTPGFDREAWRNATGLRDAAAPPRFADGAFQEFATGCDTIRLWPADISVVFPDPWAVPPGLTPAAAGPIVSSGTTP